MIAAPAVAEIVPQPVAGEIVHTMPLPLPSFAIVAVKATTALDATDCAPVGAVMLTAVGVTAIAVCTLAEMSATELTVTVAVQAAASGEGAV